MSSRTFSPCIVVPCYNHGYALATLAEELSVYNLPTIFVNDGSTDDTAEVLEGLSRRYSWVSTRAQVTNGGKGAAVCSGLEEAASRGFSHALLVDADGQHDSQDIPKFINRSQASQESLILGAPRFGPDAPLCRRIGREFSNLFAVIATWSFAARDVLCGFRVYPIAPLFQAMRVDRLQPRMGFDAELVVRAVWAGIPVINIPTKVQYPEHGVSHFRYGADNVQLVGLYTRLVLQGLIRGPLRIFGRLLGRRAGGQEWYQIAERGSLRGLRLLLVVMEKVGRIPLFVLMMPIVLHMFVWGQASRRAAVDFQREVARQRGESLTTFATYGRALRQFWEFGVSIVEKVVSWREGVPLEKFSWVGRDEVRTHLATGRGAIFMGAHVGNIEVIRALGEHRKIVVNALMFTANSRHFRAFLEEVNKNSYLRVIEVSSMDPSIVFDLQERLNRGEIVALLGDRIPRYSRGRAVQVPFLGRKADFPEGPWILCGLLDAPVFSVFSMREAGGRYHVTFERLADRVELPRHERRQAIARYAQELAARLDAVVRRYPYQWFNFYDFWASSPVKETALPAKPISIDA